MTEDVKAESRLMTVTLTMVVEALQDDELAETGFFDCVGEAEEAELTNLIVDYNPREIAEQIPYVITSPDNEMFAGSALFVKLSDVKVVSSSWASALQSEAGE